MPAVQKVRSLADFVHCVSILVCVLVYVFFTSASQVRVHISNLHLALIL